MHCTAVLTVQFLENEDPKQKTFNLTSPVTDWSNMSHLVKRHLLEDSPHHDCVEQGQSFLRVTSVKSKSIGSSLSSLHDETVAKNRHILSKIFDAMVLCGNKNLPLHSHTEEKSYFMATLKAIAKAEVLARHLKLQLWSITRPLRFRSSLLNYVLSKVLPTLRICVINLLTW